MNTKNIALAIKKLETSITNKDFTFRKVAETELGYIYEQCDRDTTHVVSYEIFRKRTRNKESWKSAIGKKLTQEAYDNMPDIKEVYPNDESFGSWAWSYPKLALAEAKLYSLLPVKAHQK